MRSTVREEHSNRPAGQGHPPVAKAAPPMNELPPVKKSRDADQGPKGAPFSSSLEEFLRLRGKQVDPKESAAMQKEKPPSPLQISERATPLRTVDIAPGVTDGEITIDSVVIL